MNLDWKEISQSEGYRSLKAAMIQDIQCKHRSKKESNKKFQWVISRAMHYAHHQNRTIIEVLNSWESKRDYWWLNYYQDARQPRLFNSPNVCHRSLKSHRDLDIHSVRNAPDKAARIASIKARYFNILKSEQKDQSKRKGSKARWDRSTREYRKLIKKGASLLKKSVSH